MRKFIKKEAPLDARDGWIFTAHYWKNIVAFQFQVGQFSSLQRVHGVKLLLI